MYNFEILIFITFYIQEHSSGVCTYGKKKYNSILNFVKQNILQQFRPTIAITDYETALREMIVRNFPSATIHGCWFHVNQVG